MSVEELLRQIRRDYEMTRDSVQVGRLSLDFYRVSDPESLLTEEVLRQSHDQLVWQPYWAESWDTAHGMAIELSERDLKNKQVLDLGCGLGLIL